MPGLGTALISSLVGLFGLFLVAANTWWHPAIVMSIGLVFITGPSVGLAILFSDLREDRDLQSLMPVLGVALAIGVGGSAFWFLPETRILAISLLGETGSIEKALQEPNHNVQVAACRRSFETEGGLQTSLKKMIAHPKLAKDCLPKTTDARVRQVEYSVASIWYSKLMSKAPLSPELSCSYAQTMDTFTSRAKDNQDLRMMNCALNASTEATRLCCAGVLQSRKQTGDAINNMLLSQSAKSVEHHIPGPLVGLAFGETATVKRLSSVQDALSMPLDKIKDSSLSVACYGLATDEEGEHARPYLEWLLGKKESKTCMTPIQIQESRNIALLDVCDLLMTHKNKEPADERVCNAVLTQVKTAQVARLKRAQRNAKNLEGMTDGIKQGHNFQIAGRTTMDGMLGSMEGMINGQPQYGQRPYVEGQTLENESQRDARLMKELEAKAGFKFSKMTRASAKELTDSAAKVNIDAARALVTSVEKDGFSGTPTKEQISAATAMTSGIKDGAGGANLDSKSKGAAQTPTPTKQVGSKTRIK